MDGLLVAGSGHSVAVSSSTPSAPALRCMLIDWLRFSAALLLLLVPIGLFQGKKIRFRPISRDWSDHWPQILTLGLHWIDFFRAILGAWLLLDALALAPEARGLMRYSVFGVQGAVVVLAVALQTVVCKELDSIHAPFAFVSGLLFGLYPPIIAAIPLVLALTVAVGARSPAAYFPVLALLLVGVGFAFEGKRLLVLLIIGFCAAILPWLYSLMFSREIVLTYRARRSERDLDNPRSPQR